MGHCFDITAAMKAPYKKVQLDFVDSLATLWSFSGQF